MYGKQVIGIDINPLVQPGEVPENLYLQIDDLNQRCYLHIWSYFEDMLTDLEGLRSHIAILISSILKWWLLEYTSIDGPITSEICFECFEEVVGVN